MGFGLVLKTDKEIDLSEGALRVYDEGVLEGLHGLVEVVGVHLGHGQTVQKGDRGAILIHELLGTRLRP